MAAERERGVATVRDDKLCWGDTWLPPILGVLGIADDGVRGVHLHAEYGNFLLVKILYNNGEPVSRVIPIFGTNWISSVVGAPRGVQVIKIEIELGFFVICHCRFVPIDTSIDDVVAALKASAEAEES